MSWFDSLRDVLGGASAMRDAEHMAERERKRAEVKDVLGKLSEAPDVGELESRILGAGLFSGGVGMYDPDANLTAAQGGSVFYRRLSQAARDLNPLIQERAIEIAAYLYDSNPLAKRALEINRDYIVGEGVKVSSHDSDDSSRDSTQEALDLFWEDPYNNMDVRIHDRVLDLGIFGEQCWPVFVNPVDGSVRIANVDPAMIREIVTDPLNTDLVTDVVLKTTPTVATGAEMSANYNDVRLRAIRVETDITSPNYGRLVGVETDKDGKILTEFQPLDSFGKPMGKPRVYDGMCFIFQINKIGNSKRGRSDLMSLIDWVDGYDQILFNEIDRGLLMRAFIWDVSMKGASKKDIEDYIKEQGTPKAGSVRGHNDQVTWSAISPNLEAHDVSEGADLLLTYISTGTGIPKTWVNGMMDVNRATAQGMSEPAFKRLSSRQRYVKYIIEYVVTFALDQAELAGRLKRRANLPGVNRPEPWNISADMPELFSKDLHEAAQTLLFVAQACTILRADEAIDVDLEQEVAALAIGQIGLEVDIEILQERLQKQKEEQDKQQQQLARNPALNTMLSSAVTSVRSAGQGSAVAAKSIPQAKVASASPTATSNGKTPASPAGKGTK